MASRKPKKLSLEEEQRALSQLAADVHAPDVAERLRQALASPRSLIVERAARIIREYMLEGFDAPLKQAFERFLDDPKSDPACQAKQAAIEALDYAQSADPTPFTRAAGHIQMSGSSDMAAPMRARALLALARIGAHDFDMLAARRLDDAQPPVRQAALDALAYRGERAYAGLALFKLRLGDEDPMVTLAAMTALLTLAPEWGRDELALHLDDARSTKRELAAVALGQSRDDASLTLLLEAVKRCPRPELRDPLWRGIGLHRSTRALATLLEVIAERTLDEARSAIEALAPRRFEPGLTERVRDAAQRNERARLLPIVDQYFERV